MERNGTIQLTVTMLVTIIISIAIFAIGTALLYQFFSNAENIRTELDEKTEDQLALLLNQGQQVAIAFNSKEIRRGQSYLFGIAVLNSEDRSVFGVTITLSKAVDKANQEFPPAYTANFNATQWLRYDALPFTLTKGEQHTIPLLVTVPKTALSGTYIFNVKIERNAQPYDTIKKLYVVVP